MSKSRKDWGEKRLHALNGAGLHRRKAKGYERGQRRNERRKVATR